jgi:tetratricopeptide (TPR) repeat protein
VYGGLGEPQRALEYFGQALPMRREVGDRAGEAVTLNNIGAVYDGLGEPRRALEYYGQALPIAREVGGRAGEAATRYNVAMIHRAQGDLGRQSPSWSRLSSWTARSATPTCNPTPRCSTASARSRRTRMTIAAHDDVGGAAGGVLS